MVERHCFFREKARVNASTLPGPLDAASQIFLENVFLMRPQDNELQNIGGEEVSAATTFNGIEGKAGIQA